MARRCPAPAFARLAHFPAVGADHWTRRYSVILPVALSLAIFGHAEWVVPSLIYRILQPNLPAR